MTTFTNPSVFLSELQTTNYMNVAGLAIWVFDYILSFDYEVRWVWGRKWDFMRVLFTLSRYVTFSAAIMTVYAAVHTQRGNCVPFSTGSAVIYVLCVVFAEGLLLMGTLAFWDRSKKLTAWLLAFAVVLVIGAALSSKIRDSGSQTNPGGCVFTSKKSGAIQYAFLAVYESVLLSLMTYKMMKQYRHTSSCVIITLYKGSMMYAGCMITVSVANVIIHVAMPHGYTNALDTLQLVLHSILASRILFNLRESHAHAQADTLPVSTVQFAGMKEVQVCLPLKLSEHAKDTRNRPLELGCSELVV
ncbi:hypothetical protein SERLA73DRAFT_129244 [Serpula lacrymans var. lacrymans S7.3]|uniref:DUF6533 domain-containing protein n=2 Tax=Serpula lacrymans var. lacrymans TaxID=341189 RepID=F8PG02_SERL3|nr:uncharacterized protein SERLADRAFT_376970 [Serpula lacrymans var. lacrymans S7.9]EGO05337.1 hypothetical protein SERLA73DRAFT_129244 [Serpula lacrymans var. lacrymans S7.3]EGO31188.1 hypothetical protein SERLADRAFT_376970 [Serpula lacrymans var. lacrymans S7.9]